jgi:WD40 repeat protein
MTKHHNFEVSCHCCCIAVGSGEFGLVFDVALSADGCMAATASEDFTARVWDMATLKCEHVLEGHSGW